MGYTDHPLLLLDGISHTARVKGDNKDKKFKYAFYDKEKKVTVSLHKGRQDSLTIYAELSRSHQKFIYPSEDTYLNYLKHKN